MTASLFVSHSSFSFLHQIDYQTFLTLSEEDLKEVGVSTFGARRKMLIAISGKNLAELPGLFIARSVGLISFNKYPLQNTDILFKGITCCA